LPEDDSRPIDFFLVGVNQQLWKDIKSPSGSNPACRLLMNLCKTQLFLPRTPPGCSASCFPAIGRCEPCRAVRERLSHQLSLT